MKNQKGITLVALIITIIVMLILAGVIITAAVADGGVISRAQGAKQEQKVATEIEQIKAEMAGYLVKGNGKLNMSLFGGDKKISVNGKSYDVVEDTNVNEVYEIVKNENEEYIIKIKNEKQVMEQNEYYYTENEDGTITIKGPKKVKILTFTEGAMEEVAELVDAKFGYGVFEKMANGEFEDEELAEEIMRYYEDIVYDTNNEKFWSIVNLEESQVGLQQLDEALNADEIVLVDITSPLPSEIDGKKVTAIGENAFYDIGVYSSNFIPNTVEHIGDYAFRSSLFVSQLIIPDSVQTIGKSAFRRMSSLGEVELIMNDSEGNLVSIGGTAFEDDDFLTGILNLRKEVSVGDNAFNGTKVTW